MLSFQRSHNLHLLILFPLKTKLFHHLIQFLSLLDELGYLIDLLWSKLCVEDSMLIEFMVVWELLGELVVRLAHVVEHSSCMNPLKQRNVDELRACSEDEVLHRVMEVSQDRVVIAYRCFNYLAQSHYYEDVL